MINSVPFGLHPSRKTIYFNTTIKTSGMHLSRRTYVPLFLQTVKNMYFGPTSPLLVLSTPEQYYNFFGFTKTVWFEYESIFQNYQVKKGTCAIRNESQTTHCLPFTAFPLPSRTQTSLWRKHMRDAPLKAHLRTLVLQLVDNIYFSPISPLMVLSAQEKHYNFFGFT